MLKPIRKKSVAEAAFEQLRQQIIAGEIEPGSALPAERQLSELLEVNRGAVREALKRLEQARLVTIQHGGATRVLDYMETAGLDLLSSLLLSNSGQINQQVARSIMEMRSTLGPDIARRAAMRRSDAIAEELIELAEEMTEYETDMAGLSVRSQINFQLWGLLLKASDNVAYQLAFNTIRRVYDDIRDVMSAVLADELSDDDAHMRLALAVKEQDADTAEAVARDLVRRGEERVVALLKSMAGDS